MAEGKLKRKSHFVIYMVSVDQKFVVEKALHLVLGLLQIALVRGWLASCLSCMHLSQMIVQALYDPDQELLQIPHVDLEILKHFKRKGLKTVAGFNGLPEDEKRSLLRTLSDSEFSNAVVIATRVPKLSITKVQFVTLGEEVPLAGSRVTLVVRLELGDKPESSSPVVDEDFSDVTERMRTGDEDVIDDSGSVGKLEIEVKISSSQMKCL